MLPSSLNAAQFAGYPALAKLQCVNHLATLQQLPLSFLPSLLRELIEYDYSFPAERKAMDAQLATLAALAAPQRIEWLHGFSAIRLSPAQEALDWVNQPSRFTEELSAYLWATHQMDAFRTAAVTYANRLSAAAPVPAAPMPALGIAVIGKGVATYNEPLFANFRKQGTYFRKVDPDHGLDDLLSAMAGRAKQLPVPYTHWYVDGSVAGPHDTSLTTVSYAALAPVRAALLKRIELEVGKPGMGPEQLRSYLMHLLPTDLNMTGDAILDRFQLKLFTEGSGTQIFSTTFVQWTAREILRRAQPLSLMVRYAPRQRQRPMNQMLSSSPALQEEDAVGSLVDGDMGAYYQWIDQQRLPRATPSSFLVWFEGHAQALAIGPHMARGVVSDAPVTLKTLVDMATA